MNPMSEYSCTRNEMYSGLTMRSHSIQIYPQSLSYENTEVVTVIRGPVDDDRHSSVKIPGWWVV